MLILRSLSELREQQTSWKQQGETIAFVPTMGNLHAGHLALVQAANKQATHTIVSIFVNPLQFAPNEDFSTYPRTFDEDISKLSQYNVDIVFSPDIAEVYPPTLQPSTYIDVPALSACIEGAFRPGFFRGVATVVNKLFNMIQPDIAFFGEKDYQQLLVIRKMVADLNIPVDIRSVATVREADGLAMSSRNRYLDKSQRQKSTLIYRTMQALRDQVKQGQALAEAQQQAVAQLDQQGFNVDYLTIREPVQLQEPDFTDITAVSDADNTLNTLIILVAARLGETRLIDNLPFSLKPVVR